MKVGNAGALVLGEAGIRLECDYLTVLVGAAASLYTPSAKAAGVYVGIGLPVPAVVPVVPAYYPYVRPPYVGIGYVGPRFRGPGYWGYHHYGHPGYLYRGPIGVHRR